ncbi:hypothetical protein [Kribbella sp. C-35]|uniref:hypothetical protein n=1 Tax=Kribbella sp. C-35 TaxID=2789276 RepID=UPI00397BB25E
MIELVDYGFGPSARLRADEARAPERAGAVCVQVTFGDAATYWLGDSVVFAGREVGTYTSRPFVVRSSGWG